MYYFIEITPYSDAHWHVFLPFLFPFFSSHFHFSHPLRTRASRGQIFSIYVSADVLNIDIYRGICYARSAVTDDHNVPIIKRARRTAAAARREEGTAREPSWTIFRRRFVTVGDTAKEWELLGDTRGERESATGHRDGGAFNRIATSAPSEEGVHSLDGAHGERRSRGGSTSTSS